MPAGVVVRTGTADVKHATAKLDDANGIERLAQVVLEIPVVTLLYPTKVNSAYVVIPIGVENVGRLIGCEAVKTTE